MDMGLEPYLLASGMVGVIAQRLMRLICADCKAPASYSPETLAKVGLEPDPEIVFYRGRGCESCAGTGYQGRTGAFEILVVDATIITLIRERSDAHQIRQAAVSAGMHTLLADALAKAIMKTATAADGVLPARSTRPPSTAPAPSANDQTSGLR